MATVTKLTPDNSTANATSYVSSSFTPTLNDLLVVLVCVTGSTVVPTLTSSVAGQSFTLVGSINPFSIGNTQHLFVASQLSTAVAQTVTFDCTGDAGTACVIEIYRISGMSKTGLSAVRQSVITQDNATVDRAFSTITLTGNPIILQVATHGNTTLTAPSGFDAVTTTTTTTPTENVVGTKANSGVTATTITFGGTITAGGGVIMVEMDTSVPSVGRSFSPGIIG